MIDIPVNLRSLDRNAVKKEAGLQASLRLKNFDPFIHKGNRGHLAIIAGSGSMIGAAILTASAAARSGVGKITAFLPKNAILPMHLCLPDIIVKNQDLSFDPEPYTAFAVGPGLGTSSEAKNLLEKAISTSKPIILDADALNILSVHKELLNKLGEGSILSPHLLEWKRIFGEVSTDRERIAASIEHCNKFNINILIKGHISTLVSPEEQIFYNGTGNAGMAKGGSGDVLTGLIGGLLAQGNSPIDAGVIGMYVHGLAGDLAFEELGEDSMTASDQVQYLSKAFKLLRNSRTNP